MRVFKPLIMIGVGVSLLITGCGNSTINQSINRSSANQTSTETDSSKSEISDSQETKSTLEVVGEATESSSDESIVQGDGETQQDTPTDTDDETSQTAQDEMEPSDREDQGTVSHQLVEEVIEKINQATDNMYRAPGYYFSVNRLDDVVLQVEIRRDAPNAKQMTNLVGLFQYDVGTQSLREKDPISGDWKEL